MSAGVINRFCPQRVRLSRRPGFRLQEAYPGAVVVSRPSKFGNPFTIADALDAGFATTPAEARQVCARYFRLWLNDDLDPAFMVSNPMLIVRRAWILEHLNDLTGHDLACWCTEPVLGEIDHCHAAHLIHLANNTINQGGNPNGLATQR